MNEDELDLSTRHSSTEGSQRDHEKRDEVRAVQDMAKQDTVWVRVWRAVVMIALVLTALAVSLVTHWLLKEEERGDFEDAFEQFSRAVANAASDQHTSLRSALSVMATTYSSYAMDSNSEWPFVAMRNSELFAKVALAESGAEEIALSNIVLHEHREAYTDFMDLHYEDWMNQTLKISPQYDAPYFNPTGYKNYISTINGTDFAVDEDRDYYIAFTMASPPLTSYVLFNWNLGGSETDAEAAEATLELGNVTVMSKIAYYHSGAVSDTHKLLHDEAVGDIEHPHNFVWQPVHRDPLDDESDIVAFVTAPNAWDTFMRNLLPEGVEGIHCVISNTCNQTFTYEINGVKAKFLGFEDLHEVEYDYKVLESEFVVDDLSLTRDIPQGHCIYSMKMYPSKKFEAIYDSNTPELFVTVVSLAFLFVIIVFFAYDIMVERRNNKLIVNAARSNTIVSALLPDNIRDRLIGMDAGDANTKAGTRSLRFVLNNSHIDNANGDADDTKPLADLFLNTTVLFADIVGFTAWSSVREPFQVFSLLENLYSAFDRIAHQRRVFKVETVGDCYVAVVGVPNPCKEHAVLMLRFANDVMIEMGTMTKRLEIALGPDTGELSLRIGVHSGPVTAGVLRGERARFQLFGDTVNTASRIEGSGQSGRIHISQATADLVTNSGKGHWLEKRDELINAKGKGIIQTYWLLSTQDRAKASHESSSRVDHRDAPGFNDAVTDADKKDRLINWVAKVLAQLLKQVVARREAQLLVGPHSIKRPHQKNVGGKEVSLVDEVKEIITLPPFDSHVAEKQRGPNETELSEHVMDELREYVTCIAKSYRSNSFHNFEHASHVTMSVLKLLSRIVAPNELSNDGEIVDVEASTLHDHTYGITSDPLTQFACAFASLIHDVDHQGVPNTQLVKEKLPIADKFAKRSVAEQNSFVIAWDLLMEGRFNNFRKVICGNRVELQHFRQLAVNAVMATDIADKDFKQLRNSRWDNAFNNQNLEESASDTVNRKATIVIEHIMQASDISHTMQHWHVYRKWNERLFHELYAAYKAGRAESDPTENWYQGELGFFDFYIIPLAKKLKDCGVFGKSSDECLSYALANREEWERCGKDVIKQMSQSKETASDS